MRESMSSNAWMLKLMMKIIHIVKLEPLQAAGNRCCYTLQKLLKSSYLNRKLKILIYRIIIKQIILNGPETWILRNSEEVMSGVCERKILRKTFGAVCENKEWRIRINIFLNITRYEM